MTSELDLFLKTLPSLYETCGACRKRALRPVVCSECDQAEHTRIMQMVLADYMAEGRGDEGRWIFGLTNP